MPNSQKICIIGSGLTASTIAYLLSRFELQIDIVEEDFSKKKIKPTKLAISKNSFDRLCLYGLKNIEKKSNIVKNIYLYDSYSSISLKHDFHFSVDNKNQSLAYIIDSNNLFFNINKKLKSLKNINFLQKQILSINDNEFFKEITFLDLSKKNYNLLIFAATNNLYLFSKFKLRKIIDKNYNENAYVFSLYHKKIINNSARQFFLKDGPLAFLPITSTETSVIWSIKNNSINKKYLSNKKYLLKFFKDHFNELFKDIICLSKINKFNLNYIFSEFKNSKRTLLFGEIVNKIHPIAGQGWNMTLRNIFCLVKIFKNYKDLGLEVGNDDFINKYLEEITAKNFTFSTLIDVIRKIFDIKIDTYALIRKNLLSKLDKSFFIKKNFINIANKGF